MNQPEYREFRCCMCPVSYDEFKEITICPPGPMKEKATPCRLVKSYIDKRGWKYKVMGGLGESNFKARYQKPEKSGGVGWKCVGNLPWKKSFYEAQRDLNKLTEKKGWEEWSP